MTTPTTRTALVNGRILSSSGTLEAVADGTLAEADRVVIDGDHIAEVHLPGTTHAASADVTEDLEGRFVLPGFVDSHVHLLWLGAGLSSVALTDAGDLTEIRQRLVDARESLGSEATMLRGRGWLFDAIDGEPTAAMLDEVVSDIPVFLDSNDMHSIWVNTAALEAMGIDATTTDPAGGRISRLPDGSPAGMLYERAAHELGWAYLSSVTSNHDRERHIGRALDAFAAAGVTSVVDMGMDEDGWRALCGVAQRSGGRLPVRVSAHWLVVDTGDAQRNLDQVNRVLELRNDPTPWLELVGIKLVLDGVIDACTAALNYPYANGTNGDLLWSAEALLPVVVAADAAQLRLAIHAIGDLASDMALDVLEEMIDVNPPLGSATAARAPRNRQRSDTRPNGSAGHHGIGTAGALRPCDPTELARPVGRRPRRTRLPVDVVHRCGGPPGVRHRCPDRAPRSAGEFVHRHHETLGHRPLAATKRAAVRGAARRRPTPRDIRLRRFLRCRFAGRSSATRHVRRPGRTGR